jgi:hypothetical protein
MHQPGGMPLSFFAIVDSVMARPYPVRCGKSSRPAVPPAGRGAPNHRLTWRRVESPPSNAVMSGIAIAIGEWLRAHWPEAVTAFATGATAFLVWLERRDRKKNEVPSIECSLFIVKEHPGWTRLHLVVRNFNPYSIDVTELRVKAPAGSALFTDSEAYNPGHREFIATNVNQKLSAPINEEVQPVGTLRPGALTGRPMNRDELRADFYYSPGPKRSGRIKVKMALIWEVRSREVRTKEILIKRTITL